MELVQENDSVLAGVKEGARAATAATAT